MKRPVQHQIDELAQRILRDALPAAWIPREHIPDYGIDFIYEIVESDELTGINVAIQLKGKKSLPTTGTTIAYSKLKTHNLRYYVEKRRDPVFLVLVDAKRGEGYWLFLQEYALTGLTPSNWRSQKTVTVYVPRVQSLKDPEGFRTAVINADKYMAALHPASVETAIQVAQQRLENVDPRFRVRIQATERQRAHTIEAREPVTVNMRFKGAEQRIREIVDKLIERGLPVEIKPGEIEVQGSPLLEQTINNKELTIQHAKKMSALIRLTSVAEQGRVTALIDSIPTRVEGGRKEMRLLAELPNSPLSFSMTFEWRDNCVVITGTKVNLSLAKWAGQHLSRLAYFEQIHNFIAAQQQGCALHMSCVIDGNEFLSCHGMHGGLQSIEGHYRCIQSLSKAREIGKRLAVDPILPSDLGRDDFEAIDDLYWRLPPGERRKPTPGARVTVDITRDGLEQLLNDAKEKWAEGALKVGHDNAVGVLLRTEVAFGPMEWEFTQARLETEYQTLRQQLTDSSRQAFSLVWIGGEKSELVVKRPFQST